MPALYVVAAVAAGLIDQSAQDRKVDAQERKVMQPPKAPETTQRDADGSYLLKAGTRVPLTLLYTVSSKSAAPGDQIYLETLMPVIVDRRIVIPPGSHVVGSITQTQRPGKVKGRGEISLRFEQLILASGAVIDLNGRIGSMDGGNPGTLSRDEGKVTSDGAEGRDAVIAGGTALSGAAMGHWIGGSGQAGAIGAAAGAAAGLGAVLMSRGPEAVVERGTMVEMVLNHDLRLADADIPSSGFNTGSHGGPRGSARPANHSGRQSQSGNSFPIPRGRGIPWF